MTEHIVIRGRRAAGKTTIARGLITELKGLGKEVHHVRQKQDVNYTDGDNVIVIWDDFVLPGIIPNRTILVENMDE